MSFKVKYIRGAVESRQLRFNYQFFCVCLEKTQASLDIVFVIQKMGLQPPPSHTTFAGLGVNGKMADNRLGL